MTGPPSSSQDPWGHLEPSLSQLQCSTLGSTSAGPGLGRWSSVEFSPADDFQFYQSGYHDNSAPQPFCSPTTPGPSPHYPQTPTVSSPAPHLHAQMSQAFAVTSDPGQNQQRQTGRRRPPTQTDQIQDLTGLLAFTGDPETSPSPRGGGRGESGAAQAQGLRAGLRQREEGQGDWTWMKQSGPGLTCEAPDSRLLCTVCQRDFRSLPALNGHMRSHSSFRSAPPASVAVVMPVSVPVQSRAASKACRAGQRRCSRLAPATGGAVLYCSLMKAEQEQEQGEGLEDGEGGGAHYTPPPMLCPLRAGPGLYCSLTPRTQQRVQTVQLHNGCGDLVATETARPPPATLKPRINLGRGFQADIPPLQDRSHAHSDTHCAVLLWRPWDQLECPVTQQRVDALMMMTQSSAVPGGVASPEHTLHVLSECRGDFLLTVEKLLWTPEASGVSWSAAERRLLVKSLQLHHKDFTSVQKTVRTKSLSECVEFYYLWKKKMNLSARTPEGLTVTLPDVNGQRSSRSQEAS